MRRVHEPLEMVYERRPHRMLVLESDSTQELDELVERARGKGWQDYLEGRVPADGWYSVWMLKPAGEAPPP